MALAHDARRHDRGNRMRGAALAMGLTRARRETPGPEPRAVVQPAMHDRAT